MKKTNSIEICLLFLIHCLLSITLNSCSEDNPVASNDPILDTNSLYSWDIDTLIGTIIGGLYYADSNNVFFSSNTTPFFYDGKTYTPINLMDPQFQSSSISGYDKNNVYITGSRRMGNTGIGTLKKLQGSSVISYSLSDDSTHLMNMLVRGYDDLWISGLRSNAYHFINGKFIHYILPDTNIQGGQFLEKNGELYLLKQRNFFNLYDSLYFFIYKFQNDQFNKISTGVGCSLECGLSPLVYSTQEDFLSITSHEVKYFDGNTWNSRCRTLRTDIPGIYPFVFGGVSKDNFMVYYNYTGAPYINSVLFWRNDKWIWEKNYKLYSSKLDGGPMYITNDKVYFVNIQFPYFTSYIGIGRLMR